MPEFCESHLFITGLAAASTRLLHTLAAKRQPAAVLNLQACRSLGPVAGVLIDAAPGRQRMLSANCHFVYAVGKIPAKASVAVAPKKKKKNKRTRLAEIGADVEIRSEEPIVDKSLSKNPYTESSIQWYLEEINKIPLLTREEEDRLARQAIAGDPKAKERLITSNLRFVVQVAKKYQKFGISLLDLINEGNLGLIKAAERFDPDMGYHFISYAVWWIRQAIILAINQKAAMIRLPMNRTIDVARIDAIQKDLENELGEEPTLAQIADRLDMPEAEVRWLKQISSDYVSLDVPANADSENTQISQVKDDKYISPEDQVMQGALKQSLQEILAELTPSEREIIEHRYGLNGKKMLSLTQAGKKFNLSKERVRQIEKLTLLKLQKYGRARHLEDFLKKED